MIEKEEYRSTRDSEFNIDDSEEFSVIEEVIKSDSDSRVDLEKIADEIAHSVMESEHVKPENRRARVRRQLLQQFEEHGILFISRKERQEIRSKIDSVVTQREPENK